LSQSNASVPLHFAHANGFPAGSYKQLFKHLPNNFDVRALEKFAHNKKYPVNANLQNLVEELVEFLEQNVNEPVYALGHSMGAVVSYMAACERPDLFKGLIMLDPPIASGLSRWVFKILKRTPLIDKLSPAGKAKIRCQRWSKDSDLVSYFKQRALFKDFEQECIEDYVAAAVELRDDSYHLLFDAQTEANIYRNVPCNINQYYSKLKVPALLLTGQNSEVCVPQLIKSFVKNNQIQRKVIAGGGHMFPLEQPQKVAKIISKQIMEWEAHNK
jgi:pimeloyl-ACP methyl ester carboxylesterase